MASKNAGDNPNGNGRQVEQVVQQLENASLGSRHPAWDTGNVSQCTKVQHQRHRQQIWKMELGMAPLTSKLKKAVEEVQQCSKSMASEASVEDGGIYLILLLDHLMET